MLSRFLGRHVPLCRSGVLRQSEEKVPAVAQVHSSLPTCEGAGLYLQPSVRYRG